MFVLDYASYRFTMEIGNVQLTPRLTCELIHNIMLMQEPIEKLDACFKPNKGTTPVRAEFLFTEFKNEYSSLTKAGKEKVRQLLNSYNYMDNYFACTKQRLRLEVHVEMYQNKDSDSITLEQIYNIALEHEAQWQILIHSALQVINSARKFIFFMTE